MKKEGKVILVIISLLIMVGIVMIYSSSAVYSFEKFGDSAYYVKKHLLYLFMGILSAVTCMYIPLKAFSDNAGKIMTIMLVMLVLVLIPSISRQAGGARRWISILGLGFQPSEVAKLGLIVYLADFAARKRVLVSNLRYGLLPSLTVIGVTSGLVLIEPDMGTCVALVFIGFSMIYISGARMKHVLMIISGVIPLFGAAIMSSPYRIRRLMTFFDPWKDQRGAGFQLCQSFLALGSGGLFGVGLGMSKQKLFYLPESHTDFIFSIIGEELGFSGAASVLLLFVVFLIYSFRIATRHNDIFASRTAVGISLMIAFEVIVNIGVSTGSLPTKGLPLPFISYGGTSLVCHLAAVGLLLNISRGTE